MPLTARARFKILQRDGFRCCYCGRTPPEVTLHVDHIVPRSKGGSDHPENLQASCDTCNLGKAARLLDGIAEERLQDPLQAICSLALDLYESSRHHLWSDEPIDKATKYEMAIGLGELYHAVMEFGDLPNEHHWREFMKQYRLNLARAIAEHEAEKKRDGR